MKPSPNEKLSDYLVQIDEDLLDSAFSVDNEEKLKKYKESQRRTLPFYRRPAFRGAIAAAAGLAVAVGIYLIADGRIKPDVNIQLPPVHTPPVQTQPTESRNPTDQPHPTDPNIFEGHEPGEITVPQEGFQIRNIDMLNYYAAIQVLMENTAQTVSGKEGCSLHKLANRTETTLPGDTEGPPIQPPTEPTEPEEGYEKYYYTFDPNSIFYVTRVMFFQIVLTNPEGFLASKVGCGTVDVVITNNSIGDMITFKNGDRFYSCLVNGQGQQYMEFSTHIYIEGFAVVKNLDPESYRFTVTFDKNQFTDIPQVTGLEIAPFDAGSRPDGPAQVVSQTHMKQMLAVFNVKQLEEYFKNGILPERDSALFENGHE